MFTKQIGHQGDTQWFEVSEIPAEAVKINKSFIAESERSGSVHVLCGDYDMYSYKGGHIVEVKSDCILNHTFKSNLDVTSIETAKELPIKDHRSSVLPRGKYYVGIQQRYDPFAKIMRKVVD